MLQLKLQTLAEMNYIITKTFDFEELNNQHKNSMIEKFKQDKLTPRLQENGLSVAGGSFGYNTLYDDTEYTSIISKAFINVVESTFEVSPLTRPVRTWIYVQNNKHFSSVWHSHVTTSTVNAVYYINPPKRGGGLNLRHDLIENIIYPKSNTLYIFPCWLEHRPLPQEDDEWRISVNIEYMCDRRPVVKETGTIW